MRVEGDRGGREMAQRSASKDTLMDMDSTLERNLDIHTHQQKQVRWNNRETSGGQTTTGTTDEAQEVHTDVDTTQKHLVPKLPISSH